MATAKISECDKIKYPHPGERLGQGKWRLSRFISIKSYNTYI